MKTATCQCGKTLDVTIDRTLEIMKNGWHIVSSVNNNKLIPICPECYTQAQEHAKAIVALTGNKYVVISSLLNNRAR